MGAGMKMEREDLPLGKQLKTAAGQATAGFPAALRISTK